jgi:exonuclease SbcC
VEFPQGTTLLSGDIGSGKTTVLLAIEFALFGIIPGELSGNTLLRNGETKGDIELSFKIGNQEIIIHRTLKRSKDAVVQGNGFIVKNGIKKEATPVELKTEIFSLLGYPRELLTKKNMVYRYTVYTPQEEMKRILQESKMVRLDILRKVFDIDKYKRIQDNTFGYIKSLKEKRKEKAGMISDLEEKKKSRKLKQEEFNTAEKAIQETKPKVQAAKVKVDDKKRKLEDIEKQKQKIQDMKKNLAVKETEIDTKTEQQKRNEVQIIELQRQMNELRNELEGKETIEVTTEQVQEKNKKIIEIEKEIREISNKKSEHNADKKHSEELKKKITELNNCPTCLQIVDNDHKQRISEKEDEKIQASILHIDRYGKLAREKEEELDVIKKQIEEIRTKEKEQAVLRLKKSNLEEKEKQLLRSKETQEILQKGIFRAQADKVKIAQDIGRYSEAEPEYENAKKELEFLQEKEKEAEIEYNRVVERKKNIREMLEEFEKDIAKKEEVKKDLLRLTDVSTWLQDYFLKLTETIEKQVMTRVYHEFNELFQKWFDILVEDETIQSRLDDSFTPVITQNGYDIEIDNLSGGEKTACALAYRLALNRVINDLITTINTKDLLILDEPTDGFSSEQLDKMRDVLDELGIAQVLIVSHESKIETFVDCVIRVNKTEHISEIIA